MHSNTVNLRALRRRTVPRLAPARCSAVKLSVLLIIISTGQSGYAALLPLATPPDSSTGAVTISSRLYTPRLFVDGARPAVPLHCRRLPSLQHHRRPLHWRERLPRRMHSSRHRIRARPGRTPTFTAGRIVVDVEPTIVCTTSPITPNSLSGLPNGITDALLFGGDLCPPPAETPSGLGESWPQFDAIEYGVSPTQLEMPAYWPVAAGPSTSSTSAGKRPFATGPLSAEAGQAYATPSTQPSPYSGRHDLWDIEELVRSDESSAKRARMSPPLTTATGTPAIPRTSGGSPRELSLPILPIPTRLPTPPASPEDGEHVTPFISKLCYLLEHPEYEPWIRWDSSGQYLLVAHTKSHLLEILEKFFRHTVISSFIRQLNIYGFRRASTSSLLGVLECTKYATTVDVPGRDEPETFSAADYSAFFNPAFFRSTPDAPQCRLAALKPLAKERPPRKRTGSSGSAKAVPSTRSNPSRRSSSSSTASAGQRRRRSDSSDYDFEA